MATISTLGRLEMLKGDGVYLFGPKRNIGETLFEKTGSTRIFKSVF